MVAYDTVWRLSNSKTQRNHLRALSWLFIAVHMMTCANVIYQSRTYKKSTNLTLEVDYLS